MKITSKITIFLCLFAFINFSAGAQCDYIYVSTLGNNANPGTEALPVQSLSQALTLVSGTRVNIRMAGGTYNESSILSMMNNLHIDGGYSVAGSVWTKSTAQTTTINFSGVEIAGGVRHMIGLKANGLTGWSLTDLTINTVNVTGLDPSNRGSSNYALWINACSNYTISRCVIRSGNASAGQNGVNGNPGFQGAPGTLGGVGGCGAGNSTGGTGGTGGNGGAGGSGGPGADGTSGTAGGFGGGGGDDNGATTSNTSVSQSPGNWNGRQGQATSCGAGGVGGLQSSDGSCGGSGVGANGATCSPGAAGVNGTTNPSSFAGGFYVPSFGTDGTGGIGGGGGSGGGGGAGDDDWIDVAGDGGSGGSGGGGGGEAGTGGMGGGSTFAIFRINSNVGAVLANLTLINGTAGAGGAAGIGGNGGIFRAGTGGGCGCGDGNRGGAGGGGAAGGKGGDGGFGGNGLTGQLYTDGAITSPSTVIVSAPAATANFSGCTNSEITLTKASGSWTLPGGMSFINDLNSSSSSYSGASATSISSANATGFYTLTNGASNFQNYLLITTTRALPSFGAAMQSAICEGNPFNMVTSTSGLGYEWLIFDPLNSTSTPIAIYTTSVASWTPPSLGVTTNYRVRLRINDACCGWSVPVYFDFTVVSSLVGPTGTGATICENQTASISATGSGAGNLTWYSDPLGQNVLQTTPGATSTYTTLPMTQTGVYYVSEGIAGCPSAITAVQVTVNPAPLNPSSTNESFCAGQTVSLDATGAGGTLEWYTVPLGGAVAATGTTYNAGALAAGSYTYYVAENNGSCTSQRTAVGATVYALPAAPSAIAPVVCSGSSASLSATGTGTINWYSNAGLTNNVGVGSTYTTAPITASTTYYLTQTDANGCQSTSSNVVVNPTPGVTPSMAITASDVSICNGTAVNFTSTTNNGGATPVYNWFINGVSQATNSTTFSSSTLNDGDVISATLVSNAACASPTNATSNSVVMSVVTSVTPTVSAQAASTTICQGETGMFTAAITNGGSNPTYQWYLNGAPVGTNSNVYTNTALVNGDAITLDLTSSESCATTATVSSGTVTMTVNPSVSPSMAIAASSNTICNGTAVNFTSTTNNGGATPVYDWFVNGVSQATNSTSFSSSSLNNGDVISATLVSNAACASPANVTSNSVVMTVGTSVTPTVSAQASATSICAGDNVLFTGAITNGGSNPTYQWYLNGAAVGANSNVYTNSALANGDAVTLQLTSSEACATTSTVTSSAVTMTVNTNVVPSISISATAVDICSGTQVDFTAASANGGATPVYEWYLNGIAQSNNSTTFSSTTLNDGDAISAALISNMSCASPTNASSNSIVMNVNPTVTPSVTVNASTTAICAGETVTFSATPVNGGTNPSYQWYLNGSPVGSNSQIYVNASLANGDQVYVDLTSSEICATTPTVSSSAITMNTATTVVPFAFISANDTELCAGDAVAVTSNVVNGGSTPGYDWYLNGVSTGQTGATYNSTSLVGGDVLTLILTSSSACATPSVTSSNSINFTTTATTPATVMLSSISPSLCEGQDIVFVASANNAPTIMGYIWNLNGAVVGTSGSVYNGIAMVASDQVQVTLQYQDLCGNVGNVTSNTIAISPNPVVDAGTGGAIALGGSIQLNGTTTIPGGYVWTPASSLDNANILNPYASPTETTTYTLTSVTDMGCKTSDTVTIIVSDENSFDIVNSFTPNGDGTNDTWVIIHNLELYPNFTLAIYNRWGLLLYEQSGAYVPWDGTYKGNPLPSDTYFYVLQLDSTLDPINGSVTIVR